LFRGRPQRVVNVSDDTDRTAGDQALQVAALCGLPPPPRISRAEAERTLSPMRMSFLSESRRLRNARLKHELRLRLRWPTVDQALRGAV
jgi:nucleoside-diphosphate-sugar epimerase